MPKPPTLSPEGLALARTFQRLAFPERTYEPGFNPAPLYLRQAESISLDSDNLQLLMHAVQEFLRAKLRDENPPTEGQSPPNSARPN